MESNAGAIAISEARFTDVRERYGEDGRVPAVVVGFAFEKASGGKEDGLFVRGEAFDLPVSIGVAVLCIVGHIDVVSRMKFGEKAVQKLQLVF